MKTLLYSGLSLPGLKSDQNHQAMNSVPITCDGSEVGGDSPKTTRLVSSVLQCKE